VAERVFDLHLLRAGTVSEMRLQSVGDGALYKFLSQTWNVDDLREQIRDAYEYYEANKKSRRMIVL
jgi:hypothetical protein